MSEYAKAVEYLKQTEKIIDRLIKERNAAERELSAAHKTIAELLAMRPKKIAPIAEDKKPEPEALVRDWKRAYFWAKKKGLPNEIAEEFSQEFVMRKMECNRGNLYWAWCDFSRMQCSWDGHNKHASFDDTIGLRQEYGSEELRDEDMGGAEPEDSAM